MPAGLGNTSTPRCPRGDLCFETHSKLGRWNGDPKRDFPVGHPIFEDQRATLPHRRGEDTVKRAWMESQGSLHLSVRPVGVSQQTHPLMGIRSGAKGGEG